MRHLALVILLAGLGLPSTAHAQGCAWRPWAASWSKLNRGPDLDPPNKIYDPTNWDYSFSQTTVLNLTKNTPDGSAFAIHFFADSQPPDTISDAYMSGGVYQEITVQPGVPIQYSFYWKGKAAKAANWFEFLLIDGPFSPTAADMSAAANIRRKREIENTSFGWEQLTDQSTAFTGSGGPTLTPTGTLVTVVLKCGHNPTSTPGGVEAFFDAVIVRQNNGPNLLINGDFESTAQQPLCDNQRMAQDPNSNDYWLAAPPPPEVCDNGLDDDEDGLIDCDDPNCAEFLACQCNDPFADVDGDGDVDQEDFAAFQLCYTGPGQGPPPSGCACFDRPEPTAPDGDVDQADFGLFQLCASGAFVAADPACDD